MAMGTTVAMSTDAIVLLKADHKEVKRLFREFQAARKGARQRKVQLVEKIIGELTAHTYNENQVMYPEVRKLLPDLEDDVLESYEEHHVADVLTFELATMSSADDHFDAKVTVLIENVTHHIEEEEQEWFPKVREGLTRKQLQDIGARMLELKSSAPRKPTQPKAMKNALDAMTA
jgi:hemerythrin superfamily protein